MYCSKHGWSVAFLLKNRQSSSSVEKIRREFTTIVQIGWQTKIWGPHLFSPHNSF